MNAVVVCFVLRLLYSIVHSVSFSVPISRFNETCARRAVLYNTVDSIDDFNHIVSDRCLTNELRVVYLLFVRFSLLFRMSVHVILIVS